jgi:hypothetical protein
LKRAFAHRARGRRRCIIDPVNRNLRVVFSKAEGGEHHYTEIAHGIWFLGREPVLSGEPIPPEVLTGIEKQTPAACEHAKGTIRYARADTLYTMDFEAIHDATSSGR